MKFKKDAEPVFTTEPWYDLMEGGYIKPTDLLEDEELANKVNDALDLVSDFMQEAELNGLIEIG